MLQLIKTYKNFIFAFFRRLRFGHVRVLSNVEPFIVNMGSREVDMVLNESDFATLVKIAFNVDTKLTKENLSQTLEVYKKASLSQGSYSSTPLDAIMNIYPADMTKTTRRP